MAGRLEVTTPRSENLRVIWSDSTFTPPNVYYGLFNGEYYITIKDSTSVYLFISENQQVYAAVRSNCQAQYDPIIGMIVYMINAENPFALQLISGPPRKTVDGLAGLDRFAFQNISPLQNIYPSN